jgi:anionic cell wall polymer biosynthesis LytR-Cps2A-Psr (LCP) family protein
MAGKRRAGREPQPPSRRRGRATPPQPAATTFPSPAQPPVVQAPRKTRRELRDDRKRQQRKRLGTAGVAGIAVAGLVVAAAIGFGVKKATDDGHEPRQGQTTVLFALGGADHNAAESALLAHDTKTGQGVELLLPARVLTEVCGVGSQPLTDLLALPDGQRLSRSAVSNLLGGVQVDASWVLTTDQLARLVDEVGGITADIDSDVIRDQPGGGRVVLLRKGSGQHLTGSRAVAYATYAPKGEDASGNLVRLQAVLDGLLKALPTDAGQAAKLIDSLGKGAGSTIGSRALADTLTGLATALHANQVLPTGLPVVKLDTGGPPSYRVDPAGTRQFVDGNLAASLPAGARENRTRVFVQNGVGTPGLVASACEKLVNAGYGFAGSGNAPHFGFKASKVLVFDRSVPSAELANNVARVLALPLHDVKSSVAGQNVADVLVILGKDYKP